MKRTRFIVDVKSLFAANIYLLVLLDLVATIKLSNIISYNFAKFTALKLPENSIQLGKKPEF